MSINIKHIGFILDGNGRWAKKQNKPRTYGHKFGVQKIKEVISWCINKEIKTVSMYAFSVENWKRPANEVNYIMKQVKNKFFNKDTIKFFQDNNIRFIWNGFDDKLDDKLVNKFHEVENLTKNNTKLNFQLLFNYGSLQKVVELINHLDNTKITVDDFNEKLDPYQLGYLDLIIRTSNEQRLSNFMLLQASYAELIFSKLYWPEYSEQEFENNINEYFNRNRRFGGVNNE